MEEGKQEAAASFKTETINGQPYILLNSGRRMPMMGYGSYKADQEGLLVKILKEAVLDVGYRHIDTASMYQNEEEIGQALGEIIATGQVKREDLFITSKIWHSEKSDVEGALKRSLDKLKLDYLDLYLIHWPSPGWEADSQELKRLPLHVIWEQMEKLAKSGLVKDIGVSNFNSQTLLHLLNAAEIPPCVNQIELHPYLPQRELVSYFQKYYEIQVTAFCPVARAGTTPTFKAKVLSEEPAVLKIAEQVGRSPYQVALRWGIQLGHAVIPKTSNSARLKENFESLHFTLSTHQMDEITALGCNFRGCDSKDREFMKFTPIFD